MRHDTTEVEVIQELDEDKTTSTFSRTSKDKKEITQDASEGDTSKTKACYILVGKGAKNLRLSQQNVGKEDITFFDNDLGWCFQKKEDALEIAKKYSRNGEEIKVSPYFSERANRKWHGTKLEQKAVRKETKYLIKKRNTEDKKRKIIDICNNANFDFSFLIDDKAPDDFNENQKKIFDFLKKGEFHEWMKDQEICEEFKKEWESVEEEIKNNPSGDIESQIVKKLNEKHAVLRHTQTYFLREEPNILCGGKDFVLESKQSFKDFYENKLVKCSDGKIRSEAEIWIKSPDRREYQGLTFDTTGKAETLGLYNIWKGFSCDPSIKGSCELYKKLIREVICSRTPAFFEYIWRWMSMLVQKPHEIPEVAILLMGLQGTGKGVFVKTLGRLLGQHFLHLDNIDRLLANFNSHMTNVVLVFADEAVWEGGKKDIGKLKAMISEETVVIEQKGKDLFTIKNYRHFIFSSNEDLPVHLDHDDRRFLVLKVSSEHKEDYKYFEEILYELENGGYERLLYELQTEDISDFNPRKIPLNLDAFEVKMQDAPSADNYIFHALKEGSFDIGNEGPTGGWRDTILVQSVHTDYKSWCAKEQLHPMESRPFGKRISKLLSKPDKTRPNVPQGEKKLWYYLFPSLLSTRASFEKAYKVDSSIWD